MKVWDGLTGGEVTDLSELCPAKYGTGVAKSADGLAVAIDDLVLFDPSARTLLRRTRLRVE